MTWSCDLAHQMQYSYFARDPDDKTVTEKRVAGWECPVEGTVVKWHVRSGDEVAGSRCVPESLPCHSFANRVETDIYPVQTFNVLRDPLLQLLEPCTHPVQLEGLCALCGKDLTGYVDDATACDSPTVAQCRTYRCPQVICSKASNPRCLLPTLGRITCRTHRRTGPTSRCRTSRLDCLFPWK